MRFGSTAKVLAECKLEYYRISECDWLVCFSSQKDGGWLTSCDMVQKVASNIGDWKILEKSRCIVPLRMFLTSSGAKQERFKKAEKASMALLAERDFASLGGHLLKLLDQVPPTHLLSLRAERAESDCEACFDPE